MGLPRVSRAAGQGGGSERLRAALARCFASLPGRHRGVACQPRVQPCGLPAVRFQWLLPGVSRIRGAPVARQSTGFGRPNAIQCLTPGGAEGARAHQAAVRPRAPPVMGPSCVLLRSVCERSASQLSDSNHSRLNCLQLQQALKRFCRSCHSCVEFQRSHACPPPQLRDEPVGAVVVSVV